MGESSGRSAARTDRNSRVERPRSGRPRRKPGWIAGPVAEAVEPRLLFAAIQVTMAADVNNAADGVTTLREALAQAATLTGPDTITFAPALSGATITLDPALGGLN